MLQIALITYESTIAEFPEAVVARNGKAEVLRDLNRLPEALACYEETIIKFPEAVVARCGKAEVLRELNRLPEALAYYEETIANFSEAVVARCGKAEVLRELNRLPEALVYYEETIAKFSGDAVARCGKAGFFLFLNFGFSHTPARDCCEAALGAGVLSLGLPDNLFGAISNSLLYGIVAMVIVRFTSFFSKRKVRL